MSDSFLRSKFLLITSLLIVGAYLVFNQNTNTQLKATTPETEINEPEESVSTNEENENQPDAKYEQNTPAPTQKPVATSPSETKSDTIFSLQELIFPGAEIINSTNSELYLATDASFDNVWSWYQDKFNSMSFSSTSVVNTNVNGNRLVDSQYAKSGLKINFNLEAKETDGQVEVKIRLDSD